MEEEVVHQVDQLELQVLSFGFQSLINHLGTVEISEHNKLIPGSTTIILLSIKMNKYVH